MSLLVQPGLDQSLAGKQQRVANRIRMASFGVFNQMAQTYQQLYNLVWTNPAGLTPQQVAAALGTDAAQLFSVLTVLSNAVNAAKPGAISVGTTPSGYTITSNADGTATINSKS